MIKHFQKWLESEHVTKGYREKGRRLQDHPSDIKAVTAVTTVTQLMTRSRHLSPQNENDLSDGILREGGYTGNTGYNTDSARIYPVTNVQFRHVPPVTDQSGLDTKLAERFRKGISIRIERGTGRALILIKTSRRGR